MSAHITALVLAAGKSSRMGTANKLLLKFQDQAMISHVIDQLLASAAHDIVVVTGNEYDEVTKSITQNVKFTHNPDYEMGLSSSLKAGISALHKDCDGVIVCLGDMPYISSRCYDQLIAAFEAGKIIVPTSNGKIGNPVIFSKEYFSDFLTLGGDMGARKLLKKYPDNVVRIDVNTDAIFDDIDTPESYEDILSRF